MTTIPSLSDVDLSNLHYGPAKGVYSYTASEAPVVGDTEVSILAVVASQALGLSAQVTASRFRTVYCYGAPATASDTKSVYFMCVRIGIGAERWFVALNPEVPLDASHEITDFDHDALLFRLAKMTRKLVSDLGDWHLPSSSISLSGATYYGSNIGIGTITYSAATSANLSSLPAGTKKVTMKKGQQMLLQVEEDGTVYLPKGWTPMIFGGD